MRSVIIQQNVTLDGYAAGTGGDLDFMNVVNDWAEVDADNVDLLDTIDTILLGANTYRLFADYWPDAADEPVAQAVNSIPKIVYSRRLREVHWGDWPAPALITDDPIADVTARRQQDGANLIVWGSLTLTAALLAAGVADELQLRILPTAVGAGRSFFPAIPNRMDLELVDCRTYRSGIVAATYRPNGSS